MIADVRGNPRSAAPRRRRSTWSAAPEVSIAKRLPRRRRSAPALLARVIGTLALTAGAITGSSAAALAAEPPSPSPTASSETSPDPRSSASPTSSADLYDPGAVTVTPPAPTGTTSFAYTASRSVSKGKFQSIYGGCPAGWYVRPGQPSAQVPTSPNPSVAAATGEYVASEGASFFTSIPSTGNGHLYQNVTDQFHNWSIASDHPASLTWWCDAVPSWYADAPPLTKNATGDVGVSPVDPSCFYCNMTTQYTNLSTGLALDPGGTTGGPVLVQQPTGTSSQNWYLQGDSGGNAFEYGIATFGFWQPATLLSTAIADVNGSFVFASASDEPPAGGQISYVDWGAGQVSNAVMLIQTDTTWSGSTPLGGYCLTGSGGVGSQVTAEPCDATDDAQWWVQEAGK